MRTAVGAVEPQQIFEGLVLEDRVVRNERIDPRLATGARRVFGRFVAPGHGGIPIWVVGAWPSEKSMGRAANYEGVLPSLRGNPETQLGPDHIAEIKVWIAGRRGKDAQFEIVIEGTMPGDDPDATRAQLQPLAEAGATWWIEPMWEDGTTVDDLKRRIKQGPPDIS